MGSFFTYFISGYERRSHPGRPDLSEKRFFSHGISGSVAQGRRGGFMNRMLRLCDGFSAAVSNTSTKTYGASLLTFGLVTLLLYFLREYLGTDSASETVALISGIAASVVAIPCLLFDRPISEALEDNPLTDYILFEFFCIKRAAALKEAGGIHPLVMISFSLLLAVLGHFLPLGYLLLGIGALLFVYIAFLSPEFSFFSSILIMPFLSFLGRADIILSVMVVTTAISLFRKVIYGKRVIFFEQYEIYILLMMLAVLLSGIFVGGFESFGASVFMIVTALGYTVVGNLIINRRLADRTMNVFVISSIPAAIRSYWIFIEAFMRGTEGELVGVGISSTFPTTESLAVFLTVAYFFSLALSRESHTATRVAYFGAALLNLGAIVLSGQLLFAAIAIIGALLLLLSARRVGFLVSMLLLLGLPYLLFALPEWISDSILAYIPGVSGIESIRELWSSSFDAFLDNLLLGIGIGGESFKTAMGSYGSPDAPNSSNLFLEIGLEAGVFALVFFVILLLIRLRHRFNYFVYLKSSSVNKMSIYVSLAVASQIFAGAFSYIWSYAPSAYIFWCTFGLGSATLRIARQENDDRILYYEDTRTPDRSEISIDI